MRILNIIISLFILSFSIPTSSFNQYNQHACDKVYCPEVKLWIIIHNRLIEQQLNSKYYNKKLLMRLLKTQHKLIKMSRKCCVNA